MAAQIIASIVLALLFIFIVVPTHGLPDHVTQDPSYLACMKRGWIKVLDFLIVVAVSFLFGALVLLAMGVL